MSKAAERVALVTGETDEIVQAVALIGCSSSATGRPYRLARKEV